MMPQPGHAITTPRGDGFVSTRIGARMVGVVIEGEDGGYDFLPVGEVTVTGEHPEEWERCAWQRLVTAAFAA